MKNCERIQESLGSWVDGELTAEDSAAVRAHVAHCIDCRAAQQRLEKLTSMLHGALTAEAPKIDFVSFWKALERRIQTRRPWYEAVPHRALSFFTGSRAAWMVPAAITVLLALVAVNSYFLRWHSQSSRDNFASVVSIDAHGRSVALLREDDTKTTVIWLYQNQEGENEAAEESPPLGPGF
ncbi:MAG TPA: zf-HC2 domain-containing protein [Terriglobales bacterium]|nr:zf-HC2 domain-containing protein [Terriglobales bacterium]